MASGYAHPELLAETEWMAEHLDDPSIRIVDCDEFPSYRRLHIPGSIGLNVYHYLKDPDRPDHVMPPALFQQTMSEHGIGNGHTVIAYDGMGGLYAARLWWALDHYGHTACKVLNGGFHKWFNEGRPVTKEQPQTEPAAFNARPGSDNLCTIDDVRAAIGRDDVVIWDVRSPEEHTGEDPRENKHGGHIPGAVHLLWLDLTAPPDRSGLLLPADEIRRRLERKGITPGKTIYTHCQAGIRAAHGMFVLRVMGYGNVKNYDGSWGEWGNRDDTPIVR